MPQPGRTLITGALLVAGTLLALMLALPVASAPTGPPLPARQEAQPAWQQKVDPAVLAAAAEEGESEFLLFMAEQAELGAASRQPEKAARGQFVYETLARAARQSQAPVRRALDAAGVAYRPYWIANMIWVRGDAALIRALAQRPEVAHLYANPRVQMALPPAEGPVPRLPAATEWGLQKVNAPAVWAAGITGQGIVVGGQDTGYQWDHPALKEQYRGWNGSNVDHNYSWHDAIHPDSNTGGSSTCGVDLAAPCDDNGHGTHTMGTMVGDDGGSNQIGMAPGARWIGCRNMEGGWGTPATYAECFQWFVAPTDLNNQNPDPARAPDVINNSWSCPVSEGCVDPAVLQTVVENVKAAGIVVVVSAGNYGPSCETVRTPAAIYDASFTVGATDSADVIASFSSRGPVTVDGSGRLKPDISAPGVGVRSSYPPNTYTYLQGTSMAGPHVAGQVALLLAAEPALAGKVDTIEAFIEQTAVPLTTTQGCGGDNSASVPNNVYGYGRIDAWAAFDALVNMPAQAVMVTASITETGYLLEWNHAIHNAAYEVYTSTMPYFDPDGQTPAMVLEAPQAKFVATGANSRLYAIVRALSYAEQPSADSNRLGIFPFSLTPGAAAVTTSTLLPYLTDN